MTMPYALELQDIRHAYDTAAGPLHVLKGVSLALKPGEVVGLIAPSGAGKSTLLHIAGLLERPTSGAVRIGGRDCTGLGDPARTRVRRDGIGFVYQFHHLLPDFSALENAAMPRIIAGADKAAARARAQALLEMLGVGARAHHRPAEMSGGEQQRVAIARAFANHPSLLLADEPTGNLDAETADKVFDAFLDAARRQGLAALVVTHNPELARRMDRILRLEKGVAAPAGG
jgi:lipoprotein-releasing system ATP-binding protein